jgi:uroporphyrinogen-III synthase
MRVLITRPHDDAKALAEALAARGVEAIVEPMIEITPLSARALELEGVQAILLTSANGARALAAATRRRDVGVLAVGEATATAARAAGFADVAAAGGDVEALAALVGERCDPAAGALIHVSGSAVAGDLGGRLAARGFTVRRAVLYEAREAARLSDAATDALSRGALDAVLLFSPRTAKAFVTLAERAGLASALGSVEALCLSAAVADAARRVGWQEVRVAARPEQAALLALMAR